LESGRYPLLQTNRDISNLVRIRPVNIQPALLKQSFGVCSSVAVAAAFWLSATTVYYCYNSQEVTGPNGCKSDFLITFLLERQAWPFQHLPFVGYWDSYDNKLASIVYEPYSQLALAAAITYLCWFAFVTYARSRHDRRVALNY